MLESAYRAPEAFRGIEAYSHLWLIWEFSQVPADAPFSPTVRPPRLGGNTRVGVFATRSPFRPNRLGLSCVELARMEETAEGPVLVVAGADLMNGTPIYDIKPYLPYADAVPGARVNEALGRRVGILFFEEQAFVEAAHDFFARLRDMDEAGVDLILAAALSDKDQVGFAVMNRMLKSAGYHIVSVK